MPCNMTGTEARRGMQCKRGSEEEIASKLVQTVLSDDNSSEGFSYLRAVPHPYTRSPTIGFYKGRLSLPYNLKSSGS